jgi:predicted Zn-dependent peptidase
LRYGNHERSASYVERVRAVTKEDVLEAARKYIRPENLQTILLGEEAFELD